MTAAEVVPRLALMSATAIAAGIFIVAFPLVSSSVWTVVFASARSVGLVTLAIGVAFGVAAFIASRRAQAQHDRFQKTGFTAGELRELSPGQFEEWCGDRLREQGYRVTIVGGQSDHGIDLIAERDGVRMAVQCKRWFGVRQVGEPQIRDLLGAMQHEQVTSGMVLTTGHFSEAALAWAQGKPLKLWGVEQLLAGTRPAQIKPTTLTAPPREQCPTCGRELLRRVNRTTQDAFWGCAGYPSCRYTRAI
jgi:restriction system protein